MVDPGLLGDLRCCWAAAEPFGVGGVGRVEGDLARVVDGAGGAEVNRRWGVPSDPRVAKDVVVCQLYSAKNPSQNRRASWTLVKDPGKSCRYFIVLNWASENGLSLLTRGVWCLPVVTARGAGDRYG